MPGHIPKLIKPKSEVSDFISEWTFSFICAHWISLIYAHLHQSMSSFHMSAFTLCCLSYQGIYGVLMVHYHHVKYHMHFAHLIISQRGSGQNKNYNWFFPNLWDQEQECWLNWPLNQDWLMQGLPEVIY